MVLYKNSWFRQLKMPFSSSIPQATILMVKGSCLQQASYLVVLTLDLVLVLVLVSAQSLRLPMFPTQESTKDKELPHPCKLNAHRLVKLLVLGRLHHIGQNGLPPSRD